MTILYNENILCSNYMNDKLLYIGLNGFAGSGKDTVAKMIKTILNGNWTDIESCKEYYKSIYTNPTISATHNTVYEEIKDQPVLCIAFADQLKNICSSIFGIPVERFYQNKSTAWICINKDFKYTELKPDDALIVTAEEYYDNLQQYQNSDKRYFMSLREVLVYVGTYMLQQDVNKQVFVNIVRNSIKNLIHENSKLKYVIITDIRFEHEIDYIHENNGITITITRNDVQQLDNIAERSLEYVDDWDFCIENNGTYDELFEQVWDLIHNNVEFRNTIVSLNTRDDISNYLRLIDETEEHYLFKLCSPFEVQRIARAEGGITLVDPIGGPIITVGDKIEGTNYIVDKIAMDPISNKFIVETSK